MTPEQKAKVDQAIELMAHDSDIITLVSEIEKGVKTTKGNYGRYMAFLSPFASQGRTMLFIISEALIKAGADSYGVQSAKCLLTGAEAIPSLA